MEHQLNRVPNRAFVEPRLEIAYADKYDGLTIRNEQAFINLQEPAAPDLAHQIVDTLPSPGVTITPPQQVGDMLTIEASAPFSEGYYLIFEGNDLVIAYNLIAGTPAWWVQRSSPWRVHTPSS